MLKEKLMDVRVKRNGNGDTRTADHIPDMDDFMEANVSHVNDVNEFCKQYSDILRMRGMNHDRTKFTYAYQFYRDFCDVLENKEKDFTDMEWHKQIHIVEERHHLTSNCPDDVNLIDVMEMVIDCVCAGMARSGKVRPLEISDDILRKAVANTAKEIEEAIQLEDA